MQQQDRSTTQQPSIDIGQIQETASGRVVELLVRWGEQQELKQVDGIEQIEYIYNSQRFILALPDTAQTQSDTEKYVNRAAASIIAKAQALAAEDTDSEEHTVLIENIAVGHNINAIMHPERQWGIIRKQVLAICQALGIEPTEDFAALNAAVDAAKNS